jgi:hypothetical protein
MRIRRDAESGDANQFNGFIGIDTLTRGAVCAPNGTVPAGARTGA